jgi:uncharacterized BrkB/YihY/UPF0761 family membrane protein
MAKMAANMIKKILGIFSGLVVGYIVGLIVRVVIDLLGTLLFDRLGISGENVDANIVAVGNILGLVVFIFVLLKIYEIIVDKKDRLKVEENNIKENQKNKNRDNRVAVRGVSATKPKINGQN